MAEENLSPISASEPPAVNPLAGSESAAPAATLKLKPVIRKPVMGGGLKPGLKMPTQTGLRPGLKMPTQSGLKPGLKMPSQSALKPGLKMPAQSGLKPGLKMPTQSALKPAAAAAPAAPAPAAPAPATPAAPAPEAAPAPVTAAVPPPVAPDSMEQLKSMTQKLKGITQQIPQQAILHKTGIIADQALTEAQKQASKSRTARISLSDAIGAAPVQNEAAPMKTIRIKRPDLKPADSGSAPAAAPAASEPQAEAAPAPTMTQRKTLKIARPGSGPVRPSSKLLAKKAAPAAADKPAGDEVADIADIPDLPAKPTQAAPAFPAVQPLSPIAEFFNAFDLALQVAACIGIGILGYLLYLDDCTQWL